MLLLSTYNSIWENIKETWIPRFIPFVLLIALFICLAIIKRNKD